MTLALIMKDVMVHDELDEDFKGALETFNTGSKEGKAFVVMDGTDGNRMMVNMSNIMLVKEMEH